MLERVEVLEGGRKELRRDVRVSCEVVSDYWDDTLRFDLHDLSPSGAFVESMLPLSLNDELEIRFSPPRSRSLYWLRARVVRSSLGRRDARFDVPGMGVEFLDLTPSDRYALSGYLVGIPPVVPPEAKRPRDELGLRPGQSANGARRPNKSVTVQATEMVWVEEMLVDELGPESLDLSTRMAGDVDALLASFAPTAIAPLLSVGRGSGFGH